MELENNPALGCLPNINISPQNNQQTTRNDSSHFQSRLKFSRNANIQEGQYVISYNFDNQNCKSRTHNLLIGMPSSSQNKLTRMKKNVQRSQYLAKDQVDQSRNFLSPFGKKYPDLYVQGNEKNHDKTLKQHFSSHSSKQNSNFTSYSNKNRIKRTNDENKKYFHQSQNKIDSYDNNQKQNYNYLKLQKIHNKGAKMSNQYSKLNGKKQNEQMSGNLKKYAGVKTVRKLNRNHMSDHQFLKEHKNYEKSYPNYERSRIDPNQHPNQFFRKDKINFKDHKTNEQNDHEQSLENSQNVTKQFSNKNRQNSSDPDDQNPYFEKKQLPIHSKIQKLDMNRIPPRYQVQGIHRQKQWKQTSRSMSKDSRKFEDSEDDSSCSNTHSNFKKQHRKKMSSLQKDSKNNSIQKISPSNSRHNNAKLNTIAEVLEDRAMTAKLNNIPNNRTNYSSHLPDHQNNKQRNSQAKQNKLKNQMNNELKDRNNLHNFQTEKAGQKKPNNQQNRSNSISKPIQQNNQTANNLNKMNKTATNLQRNNKLQQKRNKSSEQNPIKTQKIQKQSQKLKNNNISQIEQQKINQNLEKEFQRNQNNQISRVSSVKNQEDSRVQDERVLLTQIEKAQEEIKNRNSQQQINSMKQNKQLQQQAPQNHVFQRQSEKVEQSQNKNSKKAYQGKLQSEKRKSQINNSQDLQLTKKKGKMSPISSKDEKRNNNENQKIVHNNKRKNQSNTQEKQNISRKDNRTSKAIVLNPSKKLDSKPNQKPNFIPRQKNQLVSNTNQNLNRNSQGSQASKENLIQNREQKPNIFNKKDNGQIGNDKQDKIRQEDIQNNSNRNSSETCSKLSSLHSSRPINSKRNFRDISNKNSKQSSLRNSMDNLEKKSNNSNFNQQNSKLSQQHQKSKHASSSRSKQKRNTFGIGQNNQNSPMEKSVHRRANSKTRQDRNRKIQLEKVDERAIKTSSRKNTRKPKQQQRNNNDSFIMNDEILDNSLTSDIEADLDKTKKSKNKKNKQNQQENNNNNYPVISPLYQPNTITTDSKEPNNLINNQSPQQLPNFTEKINGKSNDLSPQNIKTFKANELQKEETNLQDNFKNKQKIEQNQTGINDQNKINRNENPIEKIQYQQVNQQKKQKLPSVQKSIQNLPDKRQFCTNTGQIHQDPTTSLKKQFKSQMSQTLNSNTYQESQSRYHFNETYDQLGSISKSPFAIDKIKENYQRAPIVSFLYGLNGQYEAQINKYNPGLNKINYDILEQYQYDPNKNKVYQSLSILQSIDNWILQRIIQPINKQNKQIGIWAFCKGAWRCIILPYKDQSTIIDLIQLALEKACHQFLQKKLTQASLQQIMRMISGLRVLKMKNNNKKIFKEAQYSIKKNHVVKALVKEQNLKNNKIQHKLCDVIKVETLINGSNAIQIRFKNQVFNQSQSIDYKPEEQYFWVKQEKFVQRFNYFLLISNRDCSYWTYFQPQLKKFHKTVYKIRANIPTSGTISLQYKSNSVASFLFYKQIQPKVLKFVGRVNQRNKGDNIYFDFYVKGNYYLFIECEEEQNCLLTYQGNSQLQFQFIEWVRSESLKNEQCQYVQMLKLKKKQGKINMLREKFVDFLLSK